MDKLIFVCGWLRIKLTNVALSWPHAFIKAVKPSWPRRLTFIFGWQMSNCTSLSLFPDGTKILIPIIYLWWNRFRVYQNNIILWNTFLWLPCTASIRGVFPFAYWALILVHGRANNSCALSTLPRFHKNKL